MTRKIAMFWLEAGSPEKLIRWGKVWGMYTGTDAFQESDANQSSISLRVSTFCFIVWASQKTKEKGAQPCFQGLFPISKGKALGAKLRGPLFYADTG